MSGEAPRALDKKEWILGEARKLSYLVLIFRSRQDISDTTQPSLVAFYQSIFITQFSSTDLTTVVHQPYHCNSIIKAPLVLATRIGGPEYALDYTP